VAIAFKALFRSISFYGRLTWSLLAFFDDEENHMTSTPERFAYGMSQAARVGWYAAHSFLARRLSTSGPERRQSKRARPEIRLALRRELMALFRRDLANIDAGLYRLPHDLIPNPLARLQQSLLFFADLPLVDRRRREHRADEPFRLGTRPDLPRYYLQNFHYQSDGWLSPRSAALYDTQVEVLFTGSADAMRRQALVPLADYLKTLSARGRRLLDVGCGTGRFLAFVKDNWPALAVSGLDLSKSYLDKAERHLSVFSRVRLIEGPAEVQPFADAYFDVVTCVYLFHELPREVRLKVAAEIGRVLKPGGRLIFLDSLQLGDEPLFDPLLRAFPETLHEPYFADYSRTDIASLFLAAGLKKIGEERAFLSKIMIFDKP
jgi:ubiquinone/menaquinone biosynthesis C-methylase UbiE